MEAWSNDTTKKEEKENQEKKEMGYKVFLRIVVPYEGFKEYQGDSCRIWNSKVHISG